MMKNRSTMKSKKSETRSKSSNPSKIIIGPLRASFMRVLKLTPNKDNPDVKTCSCGILIPDDDTKNLAKIKKVLDHVAKAKFGEQTKIFKSTKIRNPLKDGTELYEDPDSAVGKEADGHQLLNCKMYQLPSIVDRAVQRVTDPDELQDLCVSGNYFYFSIVMKAYDVETASGRSKGIRSEIKHIQFYKEGEKLDGSTDPEDEFEAFDEDDTIFDDEDEDESPRKSSKSKKSKKPTSKKPTSKKSKRRSADD